MTPERHQQVKQLFLAVVDLDESERQSFLNDQTDDDALIAEVQKLLMHHSNQTIIKDENTRNVSTATTWSASATDVDAGTATSTHRIPKLGPKGQYAMGAAILGALLLLFALWQYGRVFESLQKNLRERMSALMEGHVESFEHWANYQQEMVEYWADDQTFKDLVRKLVELDNDDATEYRTQLRKAPEQYQIRKTLRSAGGRHTQYVVLDMKQRVIAEGPEHGPGLGKLATAAAAAKLSAVFRGDTVMFVDEVNDMIHADYTGIEDFAEVFVSAPIRDKSGTIFAIVILFNVETAVMENSIRSTSKITETSETYAFGLHGIMLSESRYTEELRQVGLIGEGERSSMNVTLRDPGGDLLAGFKPAKTIASRPLTHMARHALAGEDGFDMNGYRNYLGKTVVGVWRWLPEYQLGFAMEMSKDEAYATLRYIRRQFLVTLFLLTLSVFGVITSAFWIGILRKQVGTNRQLGPYTLEELIGEGGMGQLYRAKHELLKRPCAVKVLKPELADSRSLSWFEREVQAASGLTHPNTIRIFDYGATPEGNFYCAMELLQGMNLASLVGRFGPTPWQRGVFLSQQIFRSLREAHEQGIVHRDIKPQNIMVCQLGGEYDFIKVLDFGLAKSIGPEAKTQTSTLVGTPLYMAPERWLEPSLVDPRSDIYSVGAVVYYLLSGNQIYGAQNSMELMEQILSAEIKPLDSLQEFEIPAALSRLVMSCLAKDISNRPSSINPILDELDRMEIESPWNLEKARSWWRSNGVQS